MLGPASIPLQHADCLKRARQRLEHESFGVILTEARFSDGGWEDVIKLVEHEHFQSAVVVTDRLADARLWADALDQGAYDVLAQPFCCSEVQRVLTNALATPAQLRRTAPLAL
jgi:DNA-binding NtrC family response regulator